MFKNQKIKVMGERVADKKGLTFIELLIAVLIFSIIVVSLYSAFRVGLLAYKKGERVASLYQRIRLSLDSIALDLRNSYKFSDKDVRFIAEEGKISFYTLKKFSLSSHKGIFEICRIEYWQEEEKIFRKVFAGKLAFSDEEDVNSDIILENLDQIRIEFPYRGEEDQLIVWHDYWLETDKLPLAAKIYLEIKEPEASQPIKLTKIVHIPTGELGEIEE